MENCIESYVRESFSRDTLVDLDDFLKKKKFYDRDDLRVFYLKQLINFKLERYETVIDDVETLKESISYVKKEYTEDYSKILLLLADSYISARLLKSFSPSVPLKLLKLPGIK